MTDAPGAEPAASAAASASRLDGKPFFCRQWAFTKISQCLQHKQSKLGGALVVGGVGSGKTALCSELARPTAATGRQLSLHARLVAHHFCRTEQADSLRAGTFVLQLSAQLARSRLLPGYAEKLRDPDVSAVLTPVFCSRQPEEALRRAVLFPLLELDEPPQPLLFVVDGVDDSHRAASGGAGSVAALLASHQHLLPRWLLLVVTARRSSRDVTRLFAGFRKIVLDDLRKANVVTDLQQYILSRLEREAALRQHLSHETAEMLNQLHIKSNGCLLYLEKVLSGVSEGFIRLSEVREIPGTLNGLYLWLSQRLFTKKHFHKALPVLNVLLAALRPLPVSTIFECVRLKNAAVTCDDFERRLSVLARLTVDTTDGARLLFHHSYAEWLTDVKYCTQRFLCQPEAGHGMLAAWLLRRAPQLAPDEVQLLAEHLVRMEPGRPPAEPDLLPLLLLWSGAEVETCLQDGQPDSPVTLELLQRAGAETVPLTLPDSRQASVEPTGDDRLAPPAAEAQPGLELEPSSELEPALSSELALSSEPDRAPSSELELEPEPEAAPSSEPEPGLESERDADSDGRLLEMYLAEGEPAEPAAEQALLLSAARQGDAGLVALLLRRRVPADCADAAGQSPLTLAARHGHADVVAALLSAGAAPDRPDADGWTPLRSAAWAGHTATVQLLLSAGATVDSVDGEQRTALRAAAWAGHDDIVSALLSAGADVNGTDREGRTALIAAAYMGHVEIVRRLLDAGADIDHADGDGRTALAVAALCVPACEGAGRVVALLLERNANVNHEDREGMTPLLVAAFEGHRDVCELLLEADADVDHSDGAGRCALFAAASMGHHTVVQLLLFWGCYCDTIDPEGRTVLSVAAAQGCIQTVRLLLDRGLDEGHRDNGGWTPLHYAAYEGHADVIDALLDAGARVNEVDNDGKHALILAAQEGHVSAVAALVERGADVNLRSHDGKTPLRMAALERHKDVVHYLVCNGADASYRDMDGRSTLYLLALDNRTAMAAFLLDSGADVESCDLEGRTALHVSAWQGHTETVRLLLQRGADPDAIDAERRTPLIGAAWQGRPAVVRALLAHGATVDHTCSQGATALCIAAQEGHLECVRVLLDHFADPNHSDMHGRSALKVALKGRHEAVVRLLEEYGASSAAPPPQPPPLPVHQPPCHASASNASMNSVSTAETKPSSAALGGASPVDSPSSTFEKRQSCASFGNHSHSKSSSNLTDSTGKSSQTSQPAADASPTPAAVSGGLSFTQQLQRCRRRGGRPVETSTVAESPPCSPAERRSTPVSPQAHLPLIYADPHDSRAPSAAVRPRTSAPFTFDQNEHMRIILGTKSGSSSVSSESRPRRGLAAQANSGLKAGAAALRARAAPSKQRASALASDGSSNGFHLRRETPL
ncbi:ankyrin repeat domain-containing protein 50-like [Amphibalanus amphitrite]|uniref:ankyrin repeat domain-containing protein 50-like n=1 Tax=Amphibalanus amphitrite TaxID=1232801 RepID=UPI001C905462|nr:ankyrin repeat domain-containing protein 50-like [Amphibalanus amphitrite]XP_043242364.1 ankyrin repeat domain-containing protein 50-like [Amphibalanus amphitrite]XP_043242365.1 ankyrin repeat domain-containing protein 50-like [Amphibalanus amphitrite]